MDRTARRADPRFEYWDLVIPLTLRLEGVRHPTRRELAAFHGYDGVVMQHLEPAAREGWYPDESTDWASLAAAGQFVTEAGLGEPGDGVTVYRSVTIRLKRLTARG
jgi:hypothetical protein